MTMRKTLSFIYRIGLTLGILIALTPCGFCQKGMEQSSRTCSMEKMPGKMPCCHKAKSQAPFCKFMDQNSVSVSAAHPDVPAVQTSAIAYPVITVIKTVDASSLLYSGCSSPPGLLPLRI